MNRCAQDFISLYDVSNLFRGWSASNAAINFRNIGDVNQQSIILFTAQILGLASLPVLLNPQVAILDLVWERCTCATL